MTKYTIRVTRQCIDSGVRQSPTGCPVALACLRAIDRFRSAHYSGFEMSDDYLGDWPSSDIPNWMRRFDNDEPVKPFKFVLETQP